MFSKENTQILCVCCPLVAQHLRTVECVAQSFCLANQIQPQPLYSMFSKDQTLEVRPYSRYFPTVLELPQHPAAMEHQLLHLLVSSFLEKHSQ